MRRRGLKKHRAKARKNKIIFRIKRINKRIAIDEGQMI